MVDLSIATAFGAGRLSSELVLRVVQDGSYRRHLQMLRARLAKTRVEVAARLADIGVVPWLEPRAGMFLWCRLSEGVDAAERARRGLARDIVLAPGNVFSLKETAPGFMRFNVAQCGAPAAMKALQEILA